MCDIVASNKISSVRNVIEFDHKDNNVNNWYRDKENCVFYDLKNIKNIFKIIIVTP